MSTGFHGRPGRADDEPTEEPLETSVEAICPYCGERVELLVDAGGGATQEYVEDCGVCCRPWSVRLRMGANGRIDVDLASLDES